MAMVCVRFSVFHEAEFLYKWLVRKHKHVHFKKDEKGQEVRSALQENNTVCKELVDGCFHFIMKRKLPGWIAGVLKHRYYYKDDQEIRRVIEIGQEFEASPPQSLNIPPISFYLKSAVEEFAEGKDVILFDELSVQCLQSVHEILVEYTGILLDEYKQEESYQLLLHSWRDRVQNKDTGIQRLHLVHQENQLTYYYDEGNPIRLSETSLYLHQYPDDSVSDLPLDWGLTPAIVHAPDTLLIYTEEEGNSIIQLLRNVFEEKAIVKARSEFPFEMS
ncbi:hypothetical protein EQV77_00510 [Halobacillus fulvus]|nr:hypothetical protein EQV77_00510 [Halobacillus fulvus]